MMLTVEHLHHRHHDWLVRDASFSLLPNTITCLTGSNGVGKTTLLEILTDALQPTSGKITNLFKQQQKHWLGYLPDKAPLYPELTVYDYLLLCAQLRELGNPQSALREVIELCELDSVLHQKCHLLSHGYRQRVGLAQAIIHKPPLLMLDEPSNGLDRHQRQKLTPLLRAQKNHSAIFMTSHHLEEIWALADVVLVLHNKALWRVDLPERIDGVLPLSLDALQEKLNEVEHCHVESPVF